MFKGKIGEKKLPEPHFLYLPEYPDLKTNTNSFVEIPKLGQFLNDPNFKPLPIKKETITRITIENFEKRLKEIELQLKSLQEYISSKKSGITLRCLIL